MCLSVILFDQECYGCGITRACMHLMHGEAASAWAFNPLVAVVLPVLAFGWALEVRSAWLAIKRPGALGAPQGEGSRMSTPPQP